MNLFFYLFFFPIINSLFKKSHHFEGLEVLEMIESDTKRPSTNTKPVIGVLSQPSAWPKLFDPDDFSYIAASYVKYLEAAGARVVPLKYDLNRTNLTHLVENLNGIFIPGGGTDLFRNSTNKTEFMETGEFLLDLAKKINDKGEYFPVWGTCLGFELIMSTIANDSSILSLFNSTNHSMKLKFIKVNSFSERFTRSRIH